MPAGSNGSVTVTLYGGPTTSKSGVLTQGTISDGDVGDAGCGTTVAELIAAMASGGAYVNVHTSANGGGEIRGQIK